MIDNVKIVIADDHGLIREGLRQVIESKTNYKVFEAANGKEAIELIQKEKPSLALLDIEMPIMTGFDVAKAVREQSLSTDLVFLTMFKDEAIFNKAMDIGVRGYVLKENTVTEIINCMESVLNGNYYLSPAISDFLLRRNQKPSNFSKKENELNKLTDAEINIMKELAMMKTSQEIAETLFISSKTVQNHRSNICNKLGLKGAHALLKFAIDHESDL
jgi:DNA-binding NarL/FixJ family response regulator